MNSFLTSFWSLTISMAPYLLLGFGIAGVLYVFVPTRAYNRYLARPGFRSVLNATLLGIPLPLCSCGVLPTAVSLRRSGASRGACTSFLIATPQTGIDSIFATYSLLGLPFALLRPAAALITGVAGGLVTDRLLRGEETCAVSAAGDTSADYPTLSFFAKCRKAVKYAFCELLEDVGRWLFVGLIVAALITAAISDGFFASLQQYPLLNMLLVLLLAIPMYICATGSIPIALSLMLKGMTPGAAFVLLMAGPAINVASMLVVNKAFGRKQSIVYLVTIVTGALTFGLLTDYVLPAEWFLPNSAMTAHGADCHTGGASWWQIAIGVAFMVLLVRAMYKRYFGKTKVQDTKLTSYAIVTLKINGMRCRHCVQNVTEAIRSLPFVGKADVDLQTGTAHITLNTYAPDAESMIRKEIEKAGYTTE